MHGSTWPRVTAGGRSSQPRRSHQACAEWAAQRQNQSQTPVQTPSHLWRECNISWNPWPHHVCKIGKNSGRSPSAREMAQTSSPEGSSVGFGNSHDDHLLYPRGSGELWPRRQVAGNTSKGKKKSIRLRICFWLYLFIYFFFKFYIITFPGQQQQENKQTLMIMCLPKRSDAYEQTAAFHNWRCDHHRCKVLPLPFPRIMQPCYQQQLKLISALNNRVTCKVFKESLM